MDTFSEQTRHVESDNTLAGGGDMGRLMRLSDWTTSPLGPAELWPQSLRTAVSICLASRFPIIVFWGQELRQFYNDAYRPILGKTKHPQALGQRAQDCWPEIWHAVGPMLHGVLAHGDATWSENLLLPLDRNGYVEECYFTLSYSPIRHETGEVGGVFCAVTETTGEVLGARRLRTLRTLAANTAEAHSAEEVCHIGAETLASNPADLPFTLLYLLNGPGTQARLAGIAGVPQETFASAPVIHLDDPSAPWPFAKVAQHNHAESLNDLVLRFSALDPFQEGDNPSLHSALVLPIIRTGEERPYGFLVAGISPRCHLDDDYRGFLTLVAGQVATAVASACAFQDAQERVEALAELDRAKTTFFSNVSHEFRTPLTLLLGPLETVLADTQHDLAPAHREQLEMVRRNALRQLKLVNTLLDFSRIEAQRAEVVYESTDLALLTADLASAFRSAIEKAGMQLVVECPPLPDLVYVDREMWEKIVFNLLSNAFKFTFKGSIKIALRMVDDTVELQVEDTGIGIAGEDLPRLFERFYQVRGVRARSYEGSGIGLALVQGLVRLHGGTIEVSSVPDTGTTFTVRLPSGTAHLLSDRIGVPRLLASTAAGVAPYIEEALHWSPEATQMVTPDVNGTLEDLPVLSGLSTASAAVQQSAQRARLLIVDDNADMRDYLKRLLIPQYTLQLAADGLMALEIAQRWQPDLILSDVMIPGLDGFALITALRADPRTRAIPIILLSARAGEEATIVGLKAGADDYLVKPFTAREVLVHVEARLEIARLRQETISRMDEFIGIAGHELRTPLTAIKGNVQLARRQLGRLLKQETALSDGIASTIANVQDFLERTERQVSMQNRLVSDLLDVSRIQTGRLELQCERHNLIALVREVVEDQRLLTPGRTIRLDRLPPEEVPVLADAGRLRQVVNNYLSNALKYSQASSPIEVGVEHMGTQARVLVRDYGPGLSQADQQRIWERFYRALSVENKSPSGAGLGLGLHISRMIIEQHSGQVGVESEPGTGSTFWFTVPLAKSESS
ncbi:MAG: ATP-binding protein [Chloroflexota bacterium]|nr:ATP-binding protein [Chloroflexota bacterium]